MKEPHNMFKLNEYKFEELNDLMETQVATMKFEEHFEDLVYFFRDYQFASKRTLEITKNGPWLDKYQRQEIFNILFDAEREQTQQLTDKERNK